MECTRKKSQVKDLNEYLSCKLCHGYLVDATTLVECLHTFCRACILRHFETSSTQTQCPVCSVLYKKRSQCFRSDTTLQALVYKLVPSLYFKETQRREDFYRSTGVRAGSSCSDDSVIDRERDMMHEAEEMISQYVGDKSQYFNQDDSISLSLEYYQAHLDTTDMDIKCAVKKDEENTPASGNSDNGTHTTTTTSDNISDTKCESDQTTIVKSNGMLCDSDKVQKNCDKRYLQCPAGVNMKHLQKFVRMKYGLTADHRVDIIYQGEVLPNDYSLMDVAYIFLWPKKKPMRFFYRIFTPLKIRPIKIVNTPTPTGEKQLQIVPVTTNNHVVNSNPRTDQTSALKSPKPTKIDKPVEVKEVRHVYFSREETESEQQDKERLLANLQLQSKSKAMQAEAKKLSVPEKLVKECVFEYEEPDQEEIKRFAEKRDREWALQKKLEEETKPEREIYFSSSRDGYSSKKRKKSKHSKNESNGHKEKKRKIHGDKIHAEITNNDKSDLKLKVKITTNGHKHKHHKIENNSEISHKEKLLQMRQVRHKHMSGSSGDEKSQPAIPTIKVPKSYINDRKESKHYLDEPEPKRKKENPKCNDQTTKNNIVDNINKMFESKPKPRIEPMIIKQPFLTPKEDNPRSIPRNIHHSGISTSKVAKKEATPRTPFDQKTFLKTVAANAEKYTKDQKISQNKMEGVKNSGSMSNKVLPIGSITTNNKVLDRKIANLQQRCTIEPKNPTNNIKTNTVEKAKVSTPQYPPGFTVSKVESGVKRKAEDQEKDKRPSLEITLIPPTTAVASKISEPKPAKRPPPGTIPLEKIKNVNLKSGISIIPKLPDRTDNIGVLDLSKPNKSPDVSPRSSPKTEPINGMNSMVNRQLSNITPRPMNSPGRATPENKNMQLSNLQMLSKVATEHPTLNKLANNVNKIRPQMPSLQSIGKTSSPIRAPGLHRLPPKLNEIQPKFRPTNPQIRNQNIRNIPNTSLVLSRHQNLSQNRIVSNVSACPTGNVSDKKVASPRTSPASVTSSTTSTSAKEFPSIKSAILEQKVSETKEISV